MLPSRKGPSIKEINKPAKRITGVATNFDVSRPDFLAGPSSQRSNAHIEIVSRFRSGKPDFFMVGRLHDAPISSAPFGLAAHITVRLSTPGSINYLIIQGDISLEHIPMNVNGRRAIPKMITGDIPK
ncbi:hypothetical protein [Mesorhizobium sp. WSM3882]|uniref:hypothetical protein n=1 Tax=Mesorhizobium sp. WSM3882 TaxID=2029407 RepID=UPI001FDAC02D|nr:hypothetical protein [Mesorhizobium sp. WSM3882]